jgi:hypothetical protein
LSQFEILPKQSPERPGFTRSFLLSAQRPTSTHGHRHRCSCEGLLDACRGAVVALGLGRQKQTSGQKPTNLKVMKVIRVPPATHGSRGWCRFDRGRADWR